MVDSTKVLTSKEETAFTSILSVNSKNTAILMGMALFILFQETFVIFVLWISVMERLGLGLTALQSEITISTVFGISLISLVLFILLWFKRGSVKK